jgi:hypothetical protein
MMKKRLEIVVNPPVFKNIASNSLILLPHGSKYSIMYSKTYLIGAADGGGSFSQKIESANPAQLS